LKPLGAVAQRRVCRLVTSPYPNPRRSIARQPSALILPPCPSSTRTAPDQTAPRGGSSPTMRQAAARPRRWRPSSACSAMRS